ncbi:hypothetical protein ABZ402_06360 [Streptomyces mirabilis]|uniref:hypothetical protein n=1 Tax=Streptomyces mirabilis TaxID=68239 RepID=UPI00340B449D
MAAILLPVLIAVLVACLSPNADQRGDAYRPGAHMQHRGKGVPAWGMTPQVTTHPLAA